MNFESRDKRTTYLLILLIVGSLLFLFMIGERDLWDPDETRYAVIAREMKDSGDWIVPHLNREIYAEKPPLFFWLVNLSTFFLGENSALANRLPSALAGLITIFLTFLFGERLFHPRTGFFSGLVLATCLLFPPLSRWMMLDSLFTLLFLLTLYYFYRGYEKGRGHLKYFLLGGLFAGLGVLTKGPIAYLPIPILLIFAIFQKGVGKFWNRGLLFGFFLSLTVVLIWLIPACLLGGEDYTKRILFMQTLGRLAGRIKHSHSESFFFYFIRFPVEFLPWAVFMPAAFLCGFQKEKERRKEFFFVLLWFIFIFLFFTLSKGKKDNYLLPLYPAAALMVGVGWDTAIDSQKREKSLFLELFILAFLFGIALILFLSGVPQRLFPLVEPFHFLALSILSYLLVGIGLSFLLFFKKMKWASFASLAITFIIFHLHISWILSARFNTQRSMKSFSEGILERMKPGDELKSCFFQPEGLLYYTGKPFIEAIRSKGRFIEVMQSTQRVFVVIQREDLDLIKDDLKIKIEPIKQERVWHWDLVLISNQS